jgi:demethylmenaquinone methyltransferase/2-methoxy-6-polyprenyl-1,4-benzoquinol methylase
VALIRGDATQLPIASASVDAVTIAFGIRNVEHPGAACAEMRRVLKAGGRLAMLEFARPTMPVWRQCYGWYLNHVLPSVGRMVSRHASAYGYLSASIDAFADPDEVVKMLRQNGFTEISTIRLSLGSVCLYVARRAA